MPQPPTKVRDRFRQMLQSFEAERPRRGQILQGEILRIDEDAILLDVGAKQDAIVPRRELGKLEAQQVEDLAVGDELPVYVLRTSFGGGNLLVSIERGLEQQDWERAEALLTSDEVVELRVVGQNRGGVVVEFGRLRGFVPNSHIPGLRRGGKQDMIAFKEKLIGSQMPLKVIEVNPNRRRLVLSAREAQQHQRIKRLKELEPGKVIEGEVVNLVDFGAFVDLGGVDGLIHISELVHGTHIQHPEEVLEVGEKVEVLIQDVNVERERVSLSRKALMPGVSHVQRGQTEGNELGRGGG